MTEVYVGNVADFLPGYRKLIKINERNIVIVNVEGCFYAMDNACYHHGGPLHNGDIEELGGHPCIVCPWHGYRIALDTGEGLYQGLEFGPGSPKEVTRSKGPKQRIHKLEIREGSLYCRVELDGCWESDMYGMMPKANQEEASLQPFGGSSSRISIHSGVGKGHLRSGQVFSGSISKQLPSHQQRTARCVSSTPVCSEVKLITFEQGGGVPLHLPPGSWISLSIPNSGVGDSLARTWTVVRSGGRKFTLLVKEVGISSKWIANLAVGEEVPIVGNGGNFYLGGTIERELQTNGGVVAMVSAGIGISPFYGSLAAKLDDPQTALSPNPLHIFHIHVDRQRSSVPLLDTFVRWDFNFPWGSSGNVTYKFSLLTTRESELGERKEVSQRPSGDDIVDRICTAFGEHNANMSCMVCGPSAFSLAVIEALKKRGVPVGHIFVESFAV